MSTSLVSVQTVTIAAASSISSSINLNGMVNAPNGLRLFGIVMPSEWTDANITFQVSVDGGTTWNNLYNSSGSEVQVVADSSRAIIIEPDAFASITYIKIRSGTSGTAVNQAAARTIKLLLRSY